MSQPLTTQVASIAACLPEQFISIGARPPPARMTSSRARVVEGVVRRGLQRLLVEPGQGQDAPRALDVEGLARVRGAGQREQVGRQVEPGADHAERLDGLVARAGQHRLVDDAHRPGDRPVEVQGDDRAVVVALDETRAHDLGHRHWSRHAGQASRPRWAARWGPGRVAG